jgi:exopolyphosphatase/guanosine-5'-triphosphate,3'-diphosphate pyrophosphatase
MDRTMEALRICRNKLARNDVKRSRLVATEACRLASNGPQFLARAKRELGLDIEILTPEAEASLAVSGCVSLIDPGADYVMVFDIGGGSSEIVWLDFTGQGDRSRRRTVNQQEALSSMVAWASLPVGVVTLAERFGGRNVTADSFAAMTNHVVELIRPFEDRHAFRRALRSSSMHMLGTSGTVTTIAGIEQGLQRYDRNKVDGFWLDASRVRTVTARLVACSFEERVAEPCIGHERADLVLAGCAILEAFLLTWPCERLRVADRGLREGILASLMSEDGVYRVGRRLRGRDREKRS